MEKPLSLNIASQNAYVLPEAHGHPITLDQKPQLLSGYA